MEGSTSDGGAPRPRTRRQRLLYFLGDAFLLGGMSRGAAHGDQSRSADYLAARAAFLGEGRHTTDQDRVPGLLDRVPGWLLFAILGVLVAAALLVPR